MTDKNNIIDRKDHFWFPLDNAAKIYPAVRSDEHTTVFRLSAVLKDTIRIGPLLRAVTYVEKRFPYYKVRLRKGLFWYYLESVSEPLTPEAEPAYPCRTFDSHANTRLLFRIIARGKRLSVEFSHILADGNGAYQFLVVLLKSYFQELEESGNEEFHERKDPAFSDEEFEDAYNRYFKANVPPVVSYSRAYHLHLPLAAKPRFHGLTARLSLADTKQRAAEKKVSITEYLTAVYLVVLQDIHDELPRIRRHSKGSILRVQVPVNLRKIYPSRTMRNFSLFVLPEIDLRLGHYSFDEILKVVHHKMQLETDIKLINKILSRNVGSEKNLFVRGIPLFIKSLILRHKFYSVGANQYSGVLTNLGRVELPQKLEDKIEYFAFIPPPPNKKLKVNCAVVGYGDWLMISFGSIIRSAALEGNYLRFLAREGIHVKITEKI